MKTHTAYIQVPCSKAPKNNGWYFTSLGDLIFFDGHWYSLLVTKRIPELEKHPDWWLEKREDVIVMTKEEAKDVIVAWESLRGGERHSCVSVEDWLKDEMKPAIDRLRKILGLKIPK